MSQLIEIGSVRTLLFASTGPLLASPADANDFIGEAWSVGADLLAIPVERLGPDVLNLRTRIGGEIFQKFANYRLRCALVGDIAAALDASGALRDFVRETNEGSALWFVPDVDQLRARLATETAA
ncbi:DUF4180 domain-containing protein [Bosea sp. F3-2]|uniref:DUF4180 domain-containing protein n=1 Tax=Bosea sp. F3-2 TaxID=2599640 RepID=UPI0011ECE322|nr:DUF4180 domain-containing protein [Bosea sp. F3-2]QEL25604.1 DUF4180 domain-containing protein [Bosea sp. F3-2]